MPETAKFCPNCGNPMFKTRRETYSVSSEDLIKKVQDLIHEGNVTRIIVRDEHGRLLLEIPVTVGVVGVLLAPWVAALGVIAALVTRSTIEVERRSY